MVSIELEPGDRKNAIAFAEALLARARAQPGFLAVLRVWLLQCQRFSEAEDSNRQASGSANAIDGSVLSGTVIQTREIRGNVQVRTEPPPRPPVPRQLLPIPADFVDRDSDLAALERIRVGHRGESTPIVVVTGPAGVGKTVLVSRWLNPLAPSFPDGQLYADLTGYSLSGAQRPSDALGRLLRSMGCQQAPAELAEMAALWRSLTAEKRVALVLDNAISAAQVRPLLPGGGESLVVVVSRRRLAGLGVDGAAFHSLDVLGPEESVELLNRRIGDRRAEDDPASVRRVATMCAGLPLAVCVAAARMAARPQQSIAAVAGAMTARTQRLDSFRLEGDQVVESALDESYQVLTPDVACAYRRLGVLPVDVFGIQAAAAACAADVQTMRGLLEELIEASLLEELGPHPTTGRVGYRLHDLIRLHAAQRAAREETEAASADTVRRLADWYLSTATAARTLLAPSHRRLRRDYVFPPAAALGFEEAGRALDWMNSEGPNLMQLVRLSAERGWDATCWQLVDAMQPWFLRTRPYDLWVESHQLGLAAARRAGHPDGVSRMLTTGGSGMYNAGRLDDALDWFGQALEDARSRGDRRAEAQALHGLGQTHRLAGGLKRAALLFTESLDIRSAIGYRRGEALTRICLGDVALAADRPDQARQYLSQARTELLAVQDTYDAARALAFLGRACAHPSVREYQEAVRLLNTALGEFRAVGSVHWQAHVLEMLGQTAQEQQETEAARRHFLDSLALYEPVSPSDARRLRKRLGATSRQAGGLTGPPGPEA
ncbi:tetratricopeptide repeat protein [Streptomyces oryzae]|uniref:Tetratricopeptide repeat protein n=2 Tax=Streptomyces oryzae TaxID=1434886 RepID=A0ABS3X9I0_9ACTN|nr:tetratricopeptide repeat protein [Streptomyces oryzae]